MINSKKKGNAWENKLANWLAENGYPAYKEGMSGGGNRHKGDIINSLDMTIESKAYKNIQLPAWWKQVETSARIHGNTPVLFIHQDGMPDKEWLVVMHSNDWIEMLKGEKEPQDILDRDNLKWIVRQTRENLRKLLKELG